MVLKYRTNIFLKNFYYFHSLVLKKFAKFLGNYSKLFKIFFFFIIFLIIRISFNLFRNLRKIISKFT